MLDPSALTHCNKKKSHICNYSTKTQKNLNPRGQAVRLMLGNLQKYQGSSDQNMGWLTNVTVTELETAGALL